MAKKPSNHGKTWGKDDIAKLRELARQNTPTRVMGLKLGLTESAVRSAANGSNISLKPTNQRPYNRRTK
jgi:hypothetical protein